MAYDDSRFRGEPGFRDEPEFRAGGVPEDAPSTATGSVYTPGAYPVSEFNPPPPPEPSVGVTGRRSPRTPTAAQLGDVFDDPSHGDPGRDRMAVHALWELVLLFAVLALAYLLRDSEPGALGGGEFDDLLVFGAAFGLVAVAMGLSLRTAAPNLALGPIAITSALFFADNSNRGLAATAGITVLIAAVIGVVLAVLVVGFHVPGWAASLGVAFALFVWIDRQDETIEVVNGAYDPSDHALYWFGGFAALALVGGLLGLSRSVRRGVGRFRPIADPAQRRGFGAATFTSFALLGGSILAGLAGVVLALENREVGSGDNGLALTGLALGAVLLGGTSAYGRRGGVLGTILGVALITVLMRYADAEEWRLSPLAVAAAAIVAGLVVTRLVETFGRPRSADEELEEEDEESDWTPSSTFGIGGAGTSTGDTWSASRTGGWTSQLPARATDEGWGSTDSSWSTR